MMRNAQTSPTSEPPTTPEEAWAAEKNWQLEYHWTDESDFKLQV